MVKKVRKAMNKRLAVQQVMANAKHKAEREATRGKKAVTPTLNKSYAHIGNKHKRSQLVTAAKHEKKKIKSKNRRDRFAAEARGEEVTREKPRTTEDMREADETIVPQEDSEVEGDEDCDEFNKYFKDDGKPPKILLTTCQKPSAKMFDLLKELSFVIPNIHYHPRKNFQLKKIVEFAKNRGFTDILAFSEKAKKPNGVYMCHLPDGPTSFWKLTRLKLGQEIKGGATCNSGHNPELILNNFTTRLGRRMGRQLAALFPQKPNFRGRRTITFHNQRDFVFFRHYRYNFKDEGNGCKLQEIGPRFTLKMRYLMHGTFNPKAGEFEYIWRPDSQVSRKKMFL